MRPRVRLAAAVAALLALLGATLAIARPPGDAAAGRWRALAEAPLARTEVGAARIGRHAYVVGGFVRASPGGRTTAAVERYDLARDRWRRVRSMPLALNHPAVTAHAGNLYVLGGYAARAGLGGESAAFLRYEPRRDRWTRLPDMPTPRAALTAGVIGSKLYAAGGANAVRTLATLEIFDLRKRRWSRGPDMAVAREHVGGAVAGGAFYVLAGRFGGAVSNLRTAERYLPASRRWERLPDLRTPRSGIGAAAVGGRIVVAGGEESTATIAPVEAYDPRRRRWRALPRMRTPRHGLGVVSRGRSLFTLEGGPEPGFSFSRIVERLRVE